MKIETTTYPFYGFYGATLHEYNKFIGDKAEDMVLSALEQTLGEYKFKKTAQRHALDIIGLSRYWKDLGIEVKLVMGERQEISMEKRQRERKAQFCIDWDMEGWTIALTKTGTNEFQIWARTGFKSYPIKTMMPLNEFLLQATGLGVIRWIEKIKYSVS